MRTNKKSINQTATQNLEGNLSRILEDCYHKVYKMCLFYLDNKEEALDMTQEVCYKITQKIKSFRGEAGISTWIFRLTKNLLINHLKRQKIIRFFSLDQDNRDFESLESTPQSIMEKKQEDSLKIQRLKSAITKLSSREKTAFYLFYYEGLKQKEISEIMQTSISAIESLIFKSKRKIKKALLIGI
jgi:RNA polymerase sigma-70 factor (ECF subfamily)